MSFDIYLMVNPGALFDRSIVEDAFAAMIVGDKADDYWNLRYIDGSKSLASISISAASRIDGFSVNRPPAETAVEFWDAVFDVLQRTESFLVWPSEATPEYCVARDDWKSYLTHPGLAYLGEPARVRCGEDIPQIFYDTGVWRRVKKP